MSIEEQYDEAMFAFSCGDFAGAAARLQGILALEPGHYEAQLGLAMTYSRLGDFAAALAAGHQAERLNPNDPLVHTNLSVFYLKQGDKARAEHHAAQARIASWRQAGPAGSGGVPPPEPTPDPVETTGEPAGGTPALPGAASSELDVAPAAPPAKPTAEGQG